MLCADVVVYNLCFDVRCSLFLACHAASSLFVARCLLFVDRCSLLAVMCKFVVRSVLLDVCWFVCCLSCVVSRLPFVVCRLSIDVCCL